MRHSEHTEFTQGSLIEAVISLFVTAISRPARALAGPVLLGFLGAAFQSCDQPSQPGRNVPVLESFSVEGNPLNALSALVVVESRGAETVRAVAVSDDAPSVSTPELPAESGTTLIPLILLRPASDYKVHVVLSGSGETVTSPPVNHTTSALPTDLPVFSLMESADPAPGYVMVGITSSVVPSPRCYALILNNEAEVVWYRGFDSPVTDFQKLPNGNFSVYASPDGGPSRFLEVDLLGTILREYLAASPAETGPHEFRVAGDEHFLFGVEFRTMDLSAFGGMQQASVRGLSIEGYSSGSPTFFWSTFDHFSADDAAPDIALTGASVNPWHGNAIDIDTDGNLLVSFRNMDEVTKIHRQTGEVLWRLGGKRNQFSFIGDPLNGFSHQHGIRRLPNGHIILFDNGNLHSPPVSRAVEYALDEAGKTATLVWEYVGAPDLYSLALGFAHRLPNENTLICFGISRHILETDMAGQTTWKVLLDKPDFYPYRAFRVQSFY